MSAIPRLGYFVFVIWTATVLTSLRMMWAKTWMEGTPPLEAMTAAAHYAAVAVGIGLGLSLLSPRVRRELTALQISSYVMGFVLAFLSLSRFI